ncbi:MAG: phosphate ABC transporter substrate-binding protein [Oligoflexia bacterium]|nr:phosphate ABC transporter substrate-binding protein [Oligoflexia bacterium]
MLFLAVLGTGIQARAEIYVIGNPDVTLSSSEIADAFLGEKQIAGSTKLVPVDNKALQKDFLSKVLNMDNVKYNSSWTKKSFRDGIPAPKVKSNDADVIEFVKSTPGAIGYVSSPASGVNTLAKY